MIASWSFGDRTWTADPPDDDETFPWPVLTAMQAEVTAKEQPDKLSVTRLLAPCHRQTWLKHHTDWTYDLGTTLAAFRGSAFHHYVAEILGNRDGWHIEEELTSNLLDRPLTGRPDLWTDDGFLFDFKTTGNPPRYGQPWKNHIEQLQVYRWLIDTTHPNPPRYWQYLVVVYVTDTTILALPATKSCGKPGNRRRVADIWDDETVETLVRKCYTSWATVHDPEPPPVPEGWEGRSHPLCRYCPVYSQCARHDQEAS